MKCSSATPDEDADTQVVNQGHVEEEEEEEEAGMSAIGRVMDDNIHWISCDACGEWHRLPDSVCEEDLPEKWRCGDAPLPGTQCTRAPPVGNSEVSEASEALDDLIKAGELLDPAFESVKQDAMHVMMRFEKTLSKKHGMYRKFMSRLRDVFFICSQIVNNIFCILSRLFETAGNSKPAR